MAGATPVIVDVKAPTYCISPERILQAIDRDSKAVIVVHLHGFPCEMDKITKICSESGIILLEDCAQALGSHFSSQKVGTFGKASAFSFYPTKNIGCMGDGGAVITNDHQTKEYLSSARHYGFSENGTIYQFGINSRLDELQASILNLIMPLLEKRNRSRQTFAQKYSDHLSNFVEFLPPLIEGATYHQYPLRVPNRQKFIRDAAKYGVHLGIHYSKSMVDHPFFRSYCREIPIARKAVKELVSIPIQPEILACNFESISDIIYKCLQNQ